MDTKPRKRESSALTWLGAALVAFGLLAILNGGTGWWLMPIGALFVVAGLFRSSSAERQRQHEELMEKMERQRGESPAE